MEGSLFQESGCRRDTEGTEEGNTEGTEDTEGTAMRRMAMPGVLR